MASASRSGTRSLPALPDLLIPAALGLVTLLAFAAVRQHGYVNYDDPLYLTQNPVTQRGLDTRTLLWAFTTTDAANYHPLTWLSILVDVEIFGMDARGHHLTSLLLHALNTILFYLVSLRMTGARWPSAFAAALFGWHPLRVESVAWIAQRKDVLSMAFALLALLAYERHARRPRAASMALVTLALGLGLLAKPVLVTLPFALLLLDRWPLRRLAAPARLAIDADGTPYARASFGALAREKRALFVLAALSAWLTFAVQGGGGALNTTIPLLYRLLNACLAYVGYLGHTLWPAGLSVPYVYATRFSLVAVAAAALLLAGASGLAWRARRRLPFLLTGWLWFLGTLVPMIGIVQVGSQSMADRYTYFSGIGLFWMLAFGGAWTLERLRVPRLGRALAAVAVLAALFVATRVQVGYWRDSTALFGHAIEVDPDNHLARGQLAAALIERGDDAAAREQLVEATTRRPDVPDHWVTLGILAARRGEYEEALRLYGRALEIRPDDILAALNYGLIAAQLGRYGEAIPKLEWVIGIRAGGNVPTLVAAHRGLAGAYRAQGRAAQADAQLREAQRLEASFR